MTTIAITLNNESLQIAAEQTLAHLLDQLGYTHANFAVAINETFIPRSQYAITPLHAGDTLEIVAPMKGG